MRVRIPPHLGKALRKSTRLGRSTLDRVTQKPTPRSILNTLNDGALSFFDRTLPTGDKYPYEVHYAPALENVPTGVEAFHLVGRAWRKTPDAPVALAFGFNAWKYGFIADYCPDVRIAFAPRKFLGWDARQAAKTMQPAPSRIYVWGYTDPSWLARFARKRGIPLIRVEDGFLRSADLGASHATPYSLVFDSKGLYYNTGEPNDLADILANHEFAGDAELMENARSALDLLIEKRLSKYNLPDVGDPTRHFAIKARRRVLVLGQVDNDAAVRMGNPAGWRMSDIVRLAKLENPDAEILYRPHPDIYHGYQRSKFKAERIEKFARILSPDGPLIDLFETVDHVYTLSSLSGLEALLRGLEVTTLGTPFYAGWGLTDDRTQHPRGRSLTVLELFAGVYLKYPRYLADLKNTRNGFFSAAYRINGERFLLSTREKSKQYYEYIEIGQNSTAISMIVDEDFRLDNHLSLEAAFSRLAIGPLIGRCDQSTYITAVTAATIGATNGTEIFQNVLSKIYASVEKNIFHRINIMNFKLNPNEHSLNFISRTILDNNEVHEAINLLKRSLDVRSGIFASSKKSEAVDTFDSPPATHTATLLREIDFLIEAGAYDIAENIIVELLLCGTSTADCLEKMAAVATGRFELQAATEILKLLIQYGRPKLANIAYSKLSKILPGATSGEFIFWNATVICRSPGYVATLFAPLYRYDHIENINLICADLARTVYLDGSNSIGKVNALIAMNETNKAIELARALTCKNPKSYQFAVCYAQALSYGGRKKEAISLIIDTLKAWPVPLVYKESLRQCILMGDYEKARIIFEESKINKIDLGEMTSRKILFGMGRIADALISFKEIKLKKQISLLFSENYYHGSINYYEKNDLLLLAIYGPGDEIRFASIYNDIRKILPNSCKLKISCDPRLFSLFSRSIPEIEFIPVKRLRGLDRFDTLEYDCTRHPEMRQIIDNSAVDQIEKAEAYAVVTDVLSDVRDCYSKFPGTRYLFNDEYLREEILKKLPNNTILVGLSWRSSINTSSRNEHYLDIEQIEPIFDVDGIVFVNLQYDDCQEEINYIKFRHPGKIIDMDCIDQFNDFDSVASLMSCLDLVISPATTVVELAGALGRPTWLLSNSSELHWRKRSGQTDVWHSSVSHIEGDQLGDKESLVANLVAALIEWRDRRNAEA